MANFHPVEFAGGCHISLESISMNKNQVKGSVKIAEGKIQQSVGVITGNEVQQAKGLLKQSAGKVQKNYGDAKQAVKDAANAK